MRILQIATSLIFTATAATADVNVYSYRQPELVAPMFEAFTESTGIDVNVVFLAIWRRLV